MSHQQFLESFTKCGESGDRPKIIWSGLIWCVIRHVNSYYHYNFKEIVGFRKIDLPTLLTLLHGKFTCLLLVVVHCSKILLYEFLIVVIESLTLSPQTKLFKNSVKRAFILSLSIIINHFSQCNRFLRFIDFEWRHVR